MWTAIALGRPSCQTLAVTRIPMDAPKSLGITAVRGARVSALELPHVEPLSAFVRNLRAKMGPSYTVPYFDPADGGVQADCLFLLEAPGPKAVKSGFVSRNNPDETAKNFFLLNLEAGIDRERTIVWNIVPWYLGSGTKIRPPTRSMFQLRRRRSRPCFLCYHACIQSFSLEARLPLRATP